MQNIFKSKTPICLWVQRRHTMKHENNNSQLSENMILYLNKNLSKRGKSLLVVLHDYQPLQHKQLAAMLDMKTSSLTNLINRIKKLRINLVEFNLIGRSKFYSLSQIADAYTEIVLLPKETARKHTHGSLLHAGQLTHVVIESLRKFQEFEGDDWYIVLDDLLFVESRNISAANTNPQEEKNHNYNDFRQETYQNYIDFKNALITLMIQQGEQAVQKIYNIIDEKILTKRLDSLLLKLLGDFYQIKPLYDLEKESSLTDAQFMVDKIFSHCYSAIFDSDPNPNSLPEKYYGVEHAIQTMIDEFKKNDYDKAVSIAKWKKKFYTGNHFECISYIAEKCNNLYTRLGY